MNCDDFVHYIGTRVCVHEKYSHRRKDHGSDCVLVSAEFSSVWLSEPMSFGQGLAQILQL